MTHPNNSKRLRQQRALERRSKDMEKYAKGEDASTKRKFKIAQTDVINLKVNLS